jgi:short-subunit dehydrogenase
MVTGAGGGLGRQLAILAAEHGVTVVGVDIREAGLKELADLLAARNQAFHWAVADVTDAQGLAARVHELEAKSGPLDLAIANAGIGKETSALALNAEDMAEVINVNLLGVANTLAAVLPGMIERKRGHVVAISSLASYRGLPRMLGYCASKSGVNALMEGARIELEPLGLKVSTICPGWIRTPLTEPLAKALPKMLSVEAAAAEIWRAIRAGKRFHAFPPSMVWQGRFLSCLPSRWRDKAIRNIFKRLPRVE